MRIKVLHDFGGVETKERRIQPGEYDSSDEALFGLADYLVENGHAVVVEDQKEEAPPVEEEVSEDSPAPTGAPSIEEAWETVDATDGAVKLAVANDVWPHDVEEGSGPDGRVYQEDVEAAIEAREEE